MAKYIDKPWDGSKSRFSIEQLKNSVPKAMLRYANRTAKAANRDVTKEDLHLPYKEPNGDINLRGISQALSRVNQVKGPASDEKASARGELEAQNRKARKALGKDSSDNAKNQGLAELQALGFQALSEATYIQTEGYTETPTETRYGQLSIADGFQIQTLEAPAAEMPFLDSPPQSVQMQGALPAVEVFSATAPKKLDLKSGVIENDYRPLPSYRALGIDRKAGPAIQSEMRAFRGQTKLDGSEVGLSDFFSVGALLANIDIIPQLMAFIPPVELGRLGTIIETRSKKSDLDHSREVMSGAFTVIDPKIGQDPNAKMHLNHPLLGAHPYTALVARLMFPIQESDMAQMAAVEAARRGRLQNLSIAFGFGSVACGLCGEMQVQEILKSNGAIIGFTIDPESNKELFASSDGEDDYYDMRMPSVLRMPADIEGGYLYRDILVLNADENGTVQIDPIPEEVLPLNSQSVFMIGMNRFFFWGGGPSYCRLHGFQGSFMRDGRRTVGMFVNMRALINVAAVDAGAINDARLVLDPDIDY